MSRPRAKMTNNFPGCPVETTLSFLDGKWKGVILYHLLTDGTLRFSELRRRLQAVTQRMLTKQLRELEEQGLLTRTVYPVVPPRVDYTLTPLGQSLRSVIMMLEQWGSRYVECKDGERRLIEPAAIEETASAA
ncbi:MAG: winged helix-turn-helix transcriptional regulator [Allorhizobium sp.]